ncbi:MAG: VOC family protein [Pseudomonadota bacterium]
MTKSLADPPALVPELYVTDLNRSLGFYGDILGFNVLFRREAEGFAYLERESAHLMLEELDSASRKFMTAEMSPPFGRGVNLQIRVADIDELYQRVISAGFEFVVDLEDRWYLQLEFEPGNRQFVVADPDGYLLRFYSDLGTRASNAVTE